MSYGIFHDLNPANFLYHHLPFLHACEKRDPWSKLSKWTQKQREQQTEALTAVLQDGVSGEQAHSGWLQLSI